MIAGIIMAGVVILLWSVMMFRDYKLEFDGITPVFVARISIPRPSSPIISNVEPLKLTVSTSSQGSAVNGYEFRISRFKNMAFAHSYRSEMPKKVIAKLKGKKRYYLQVRCYKQNDHHRVVTGKWSGVSSSMVMED